ncbi:uncharacterized protein LOC108667524 [Hyalella azteca]|uniref:Uncharacterized protein LOC108667524 n=1 Tax=Hyalella azteca TaxID=294128 RepID=A0A8B7N813_HYAAZ|nr:uncharacterized protein LOC108667524 [Hyalella azteca]
MPTLFFAAALMACVAATGAESELPKSLEQKSLTRWSLLQSASSNPADDIKPSGFKPPDLADDLLCFPATKVDEVSQVPPSTSVVASMFLRVPPDGGLVEAFDEGSWLLNPTEPGHVDQAAALFSLKFDSFSIDARMLPSSELELSLPSGSHHLLTHFPANKWLRLLLVVDFNQSMVHVQIGGGREPSKFPLYEADDFDFSAMFEVEKFKFRSIQYNLSLNAESYELYTDNGTLLDAQMMLTEICHLDMSSTSKKWIDITNFQVSYAHEFNLSTSCNTELNMSKIIYRSEVTSSLDTLCLDEYSILKLNSSSSYFSHVEQCSKFQGSALTTEDAVIYAPEIAAISSSTRNQDSILSWMQSLNNTKGNFKSWCSVLLRNGSLHLRPCYDSLRFGLCKIKTSLIFRVYGKVGPFDREYVLITLSDGSWVLKGFSSLMKYSDNKWIIKSNLHKESCVTGDSTLPLIRSIWACGEANSTLAFSSCHSQTFSCTSGACLPNHFRCDGITQCGDKSDEDECTFIVKDAGYNNLVMPPPLKDDDVVRIRYFFIVYSIAPIQTSNFYADVDLTFGVHWKDPRLTVWNPIQYKNIECKDIWSPKYIAADGHPQGHWVSVPEENTDGCMVDLYSDIPPIESVDDPYMGRHLNGSSFELVYSLTGIFRIPCQFNLRKYPFGDQKCELNIWVDATEFRQIVYERFADQPEEDVKFSGRNDVREYWVSRTWRKEVNDNHSVSLIIELQSLYGYHVLNSYFTSLLIVLISFSTAIFRVEDFNERIMVSLTALLVLTALLTQANSSSVQTSYLKLLDVWYAALIAFSFMTVLANTILNFYHHKLISDNERGKKSYEEIFIIKKVKILNFALFGMLTIVFFTFLLFYTLIAGDKI